MALFTKRDRIALTVIALLILSGWSMRLALHRNGSDDIQVLRGAVEVPEGIFSEDPTAPVDINTADASRLEKLPFIGPVKAADIVAYRNEHGPFAKPEDITNVNGIGPKTFERIKDRICINAKQ